LQKENNQRILVNTSLFSSILIPHLYIEKWQLNHEEEGKKNGFLRKLK
jgi:hypothetical protein